MRKNVAVTNETICFHFVGTCKITYVHSTRSANTKFNFHNFGCWADCIGELPNTPTRCEHIHTHTHTQNIQNETKTQQQQRQQIEKETTTPTPDDDDSELYSHIINASQRDVIILMCTFNFLFSLLRSRTLAYLRPKNWPKYAWCWYIKYTCERAANPLNRIFTCTPHL